MTGRRQLPDPALLVITDRRQASRDLATLAAAAFAAGCRWLSLREKDLAVPDRLELLADLVRLGRPWDARVMIHGDVEAAAGAGAAGVHLSGGADPGEARRRLGPAVLIGVSAHNLSEAEAAQDAADYLTLSPVFPSASKPGYGPALGLDGLRAIAARIEPPILALGGVTAQNAAPCLEAGAGGIAVMGEVMRPRDTEAAVRRLISACKAPDAQGTRPGPHG